MQIKHLVAAVIGLLSLFVIADEKWQEYSAVPLDEGDWVTGWSISPTNPVIVRYEGSASNVRIPDGFLMEVRYKTDSWNVFTNFYPASLHGTIFSGNTSIQSVNMGSHSEIPGGCFSGCSSLAKVISDNGIYEIHDTAFENCTSLVSVDFTLSKLGNFAFKGCTGLKSCSIAGSAEIPPGVFEGCSSLEEVNLSGDTYFEGWVIRGNFRDDFRPPFVGCSNLSKVTLGSKFAKIPDSTFQNLQSLSNVTATSSLKTIERNAFAGCSALEVLTGIQSVANIGDNAFNGCSSMDGSLDLVSAEIIGGGAFKGCSSLTSIKIGNQVESVGGDSFYGCTLLKDVTIEGGSDCVIYGKAFAECSSLESCVLGDGVKTLDYDTWYSSLKPFYNCTNLKTVVMKNISTVPNFLFSDNGSLETVEMQNVTKIGQNAFSGCPMLKNISFLANVTNIGDSAFADCKSLTSVRIGDKVESVGKCSFSGCTSLKDVTIEGGDDCVIYGETFYACRLLESCVLGDGVKTLDYDTRYSFRSPFCECTNLKTVVMKSISTAPNFLFSGNDSLETVQMPNTTKINKEVFSGCVKLKNISSLANVTNIGESAFNGCTSVTGTVDLSSAEIICAGAFKDCANITGKVELVKLKTVENEIFSGCERLSQVKFGRDLEIVRADAFWGSTNLIAFTFEGLPPEADNNAFRNLRKGALGIYPTSPLKLNTNALNRSVQTLSASPGPLWCDVINADGTWKKLLMMVNKPTLTNDMYDVKKGWLQLNWKTNQPPDYCGITYEIRRGFSDNYETAEILTNGYDKLTYIDEQFDFTGGVNRVWYWVKPEHENLDELEHSDSCRTKNKYGVSVGFSRYAVPLVEASTYSEALKLAGVAGRDGGFEMMFLPNETATCENFENELRRYVPKAKPGDIFLLFISTHGAEGSERTEPSLRMYNPQRRFYYRELSDVAKLFADRECRFIGVVMSCYSQAMIDGGRLLTDYEVSENIAQCGLRDCGAYSDHTAWIASSAFNQTSWTYNADGMSLFSKYFVENAWELKYADVDLHINGERIDRAYHGDKFIDFRELAEYLQLMYRTGDKNSDVKIHSSAIVWNTNLMSRVCVGTVSANHSYTYNASSLLPPDEVTSEMTGNDVRLIKWSEVEGATRYSLYKNFSDHAVPDNLIPILISHPGALDYSESDAAESVIWNDGDLEWGEDYFQCSYFVVAENPAGKSRFSKPHTKRFIRKGRYEEEFINYLNSNALSVSSGAFEDIYRLSNAVLTEGGLPLASCFVTGSSPYDPNSTFTASITMENGKPMITPNPDLGDRRKYTIYGKKDLGSASVEWADMSTVSEAEKSEYRFFKVGVSLP